MRHEIHDDPVITSVRMILSIKRLRITALESENLKKLNFQPKNPYSSTENSQNGDSRETITKFVCRLICNRHGIKRGELGATGKDCDPHCRH